jgi:hypothetical protein
MENTKEGSINEPVVNGNPEATGQQDDAFERMFD